VVQKQAEMIRGQIAKSGLPVLDLVSA
jgi:hypothetical protein